MGMTQTNDRPLTIKSDKGVERKLSPLSYVDYETVEQEIRSGWLASAGEYLAGLELEEKRRQVTDLLSKPIGVQGVLEHSGTPRVALRMLHLSLVKEHADITLDDIRAEFGEKSLVDVVETLFALSLGGADEGDGDADPPQENPTGTTS